MTLVVGAYPVYGDSPDLVAPVVAALASSPVVGGLEVPFAGGAIALPDGVPADWRHVVTLIPGTMQALGSNPAFGLASPDADARRAALDVLGHVRDEVTRLGNIRGVELHSAPTRTASKQAFAESLTEAASWDWSGAALVIEHCDAWQTDYPIQKGFLAALDEIEIAAGLSQAATPVRFGVNWARSVIESHDVGTPVTQVAAAAGRAVLGGVMFSSVVDTDSAWGPAWVDAHATPVGVDGTPAGSLLTPTRIRETLAAAGDIDLAGYVGLKFGFGSSSLTAQQRVDRLLAAICVVDAAR